jgi:hypothetical protein
MTLRTIARRGRLPVAAAFTWALSACSGVTESLLDIEDPDIINPPNVGSADGALALRTGALGYLRTATAGGESTWLFGGLLADEWSTSSTFVQNDETDQRAIQLNNSSVTGQFRNLSRVRTAANLALNGLKEYAPTQTGAIAEMYFARGFAELQLASDFCNGIPLSDGSGESPEYGPPIAVQEVFTRALASLDSAIAAATGTDAISVSVRTAARIARGRVLLGLNRPADAGAAVAGIATAFTYDVTFTTTTGDNTIWAQGYSANRYTVGDSVEGNARNLLVRNAIPFFSARDPRLPVTYRIATNGRDTVRAQDGLTFVRWTLLYDRSTPAPVASGLDARLIEAEAALRANNFAGAGGTLAILNALRAAPPRLGTVQPTAMAPLADPGTPAAQVNLLFREKAFWTFSRGQRLGDLRRLVRQYGRAASDVFPVGTHYKGGNYGADVNLPVPFDEQNNPNFRGCLDRNP